MSTPVTYLLGWLRGTRRQDILKDVTELRLGSRWIRGVDRRFLPETSEGLQRTSEQYHRFVLLTRDAATSKGACDSAAFRGLGIQERECPEDCRSYYYQFGISMTINPPPTACQPSSEVADLARITSVSSLMSNAMARAAGRPLRNRLLSPSVARADIAWPMRTDWGGHDPASPQAELMINTHSIFWPVALFIFISTTYMLKK
ncbi:hypothetical protein FOL47_006977 [Perkinsus chesapeaki]|uniref:Uncharacterized protein n=1 Tax=Perkinsus chesapeaki TaxID=330153 RepID=A0A7J6N2Q5_PERCH|nr:hypothetical protein FOL47_006977 [Perkinsus chesapeaki]